MINFPYYSLRQYDRIFVEGPYKIISTYYNNYVLDEAHPVQGSLLSERRLSLMGRPLPYKLYKLESRCSNIAMMLMASHNVFIDAYGNIKKIKKPNRFTLTCCPVLSIVELSYRKYGVCFSLEGNIEYIATNTPSKYIQVLLLPTGWLYYASVEEKIPDTVRGL